MSVRLDKRETAAEFRYEDLHSPTKHGCRLERVDEWRPQICDIAVSKAVASTGEGIDRDDVTVTRLMISQQMILAFQCRDVIDVHRNGNYQRQSLHSDRSVNIISQSFLVSSVLVAQSKTGDSSPFECPRRLFCLIV